MVKGYYYFSPLGTPHYPGLHYFGSKNWRKGDGTPEPDFGERDNAKQVWRDGTLPVTPPPARLLGTQRCIESGINGQNEPVILIAGINRRCWDSPPPWGGLGLGGLSTQGALYVGLALGGLGKFQLPEGGLGLGGQGVFRVFTPLPSAMMTSLDTGGTSRDPWSAQNIPYSSVEFTTSADLVTSLSDGTITLQQGKVYLAILNFEVEYDGANAANDCLMIHFWHDSTVGIEYMVNAIDLLIPGSSGQQSFLHSSGGVFSDSLSMIFKTVDATPTVVANAVSTGIDGINAGAWTIAASLTVCELIYFTQ